MLQQEIATHQEQDAGADPGIHDFGMEAAPRALPELSRSRYAGPRR
ncbi:hypothetical protein C4K39_3399 [Pseudomonas sessilinigenes]|nr:hypothetical protein C4K39_3399 [Pseudomonas sessilinigenes]